MNNFTWTRDANGGGFTGVVDGKYKAYVLTNGSWCVYKWGSVVILTDGHSASVSSARLACKKAVNQ